MSMMTTHDFADAVGRRKMAQSLEISARAVSNAVTRKKFPASWLEVSRALAAEADVPFPVYLFGQRGMEPRESVGAA